MAVTGKLEKFCSAGWEPVSAEWCSKKLHSTPTYYAPNPVGLTFAKRSEHRAMFLKNAYMVTN